MDPLPTPPGPVPLAPAQDHQAAHVLARAFADDPVMGHLIPGAAHDPRRLRRLEAVYRFALADGRRRGLVHTTPGVRAVAVWHAPGRRHVDPADVLRAVPMGVRAFGRLLPRALATFDRIERHHPRAEHWYLSLVGSDPDHRGTGAAASLLGPVLTRLDAEGLPAYLESSKEANLPYYARWGFEVTDELALPEDGPPLWCMWREPRPPG